MSTKDHSLTEEEEEEIWSNSVKKWKEQKERRRLEKEQAIAEGRPVPTIDEEEEVAWKDLPIFMESLPQNDNLGVDALQSIVDECPPHELADTFKEEGNDRYKLLFQKTTTQEDKKRYMNEAIYYYTKALNVKCDDMKRNSIILSNRAAVHMEMKNFGKAIRDCIIAIEFDNTNMKAYYRQVKSHISLSQWEKAIQVSDQALKVKSDNPDIKTLRDQAVAHVERIKRQEIERQREHARKQEQLVELCNKLSTKKMQLGHPLFDMSRYTGQSDRSITIDNEGIAHFPAVFLYPEHGQSDYILDFQEGYCFGDHLEYMFPPGNTEYAHWDKERRYTIDTIEIYFQTNWTLPINNNANNNNSNNNTNNNSTNNNNDNNKKKRWIRCKHTTNIETVLSHPEYIIPQIPVFYILCKGSKFANKFLNDGLIQS